MTKGLTVFMDEELRSRLKMATAYRRVTIQSVLTNMVEAYVEEVEADMRPSITVRKKSKKIKI